MSKYFMNDSELQELEQLMMLVPNFSPRGRGIIVVHGFGKADEQEREEEVRPTLPEQFRFDSVCRLQEILVENRSPILLAVLFLLTADDKLWSAAKDHVYDNHLDFKKMNLSGINTDGYAIYQMAKTIYTAREYIRMDEIADKFLIGDQAFKAIIHSILIAKYGSTALQVKFT